MTDTNADYTHIRAGVSHLRLRQSLPLGVIFSLLFLAGCGQEQTVTPPLLTPPNFQAPNAIFQPPSTTAETSAVSLIVDTDLGYDVDDVGALAVAHALADRNEARLLATISVVGDPLSVAAIDVINTYYGRPDLPLGAMKGDLWTEAEGYWFDTKGDFLEPLVSLYPSDVKHRDQAQDAVQVYRQVLAAEPDKSVTIAVLGFTRNVADLLGSSGDVYSPLDGRALVQQKVKQLVIMGSSARGGHPDFNLGDGPHRDGSTAQLVEERWPTPIVFVGGELGSRIKTGKSLRLQLPDNPVAMAYSIYPGVNGYGERASWDPITVLFAVRGETYWKSVTDKRIVIRDDGSSHWESGAATPARIYLEQTASNGEIEEALEELISRKPGQIRVPETQTGIHGQL